MAKGQSLQPTIEKYWNFVVKPTFKGRKRLLVKGQSEILAGQEFDCGRRSPYSAYLRDTPLKWHNEKKHWQEEESEKGYEEHKKHLKKEKSGKLTDIKIFNDAIYANC